MEKEYEEQQQQKAGGTGVPEETRTGKGRANAKNLKKWQLVREEPVQVFSQLLPEQEQKVPPPPPPLETLDNPKYHHNPAAWFDEWYANAEQADTGVKNYPGRMLMGELTLAGHGFL